MSPDSAPASSPDGSPDPARWRALAVCLVVGFMTLLDVSIVNVALPSISTGLGAGASELSWVVSGYALAFGLVLVPAGGLVTPQVSGLIQSLFQGEERGRAFGWFGATVGLSTAVGPVAGGALISAFGADQGWRYVFFVNVPLGLLALPLAHRLIPADRSGDRSQDLDPVGVVLLGAATAALPLPLIEQQSWHSPWRLVLYPVAAAGFGLFLLHERHYRRRRHEPLVDMSLFERRSYALGAAIGLAYFAGFTGVFFIYTQFLQDGLHLSALEAGLAVTPFALGAAVSAAGGGRLVNRFGRPLVALGLALVVVGLLGTWFAVGAASGSGTAWATALPLLVAGLGSGLVITPNITVTLSEVPVKRAGVAGGVLQTGQRIGAAAGIALTGSVFYSRLGGGGGPDWAGAVRSGLLVITALVALSLVLALVDVLGGREQGAHAA